MQIWLFTQTPKAFALWPILVLLIAGPGAAPAGGQSPEGGERTSVYRARSYAVLVDAVVTDKRNRLVTALDAKDFIVYEDDIPQQLESFQLVVPDAQASGPASGVPGRAGTPQKVTPGSREVDEFCRERHHMVVLLDYATTELQNQTYVRAAAKKYFRERVGPCHQVAVVRVALDVRLLENFTNDSEKLVAALEYANSTASSFAGDRTYLASLVERSEREQASLTAQLNLVTGGLGDGVGSAQGSLGVRLLQAQLEASQRMEGRTHAMQSFANQQQSRPILEALRAIADAVAPLPGRKTLVLISQGFSIPHSLEPALYGAVKAANRSRLAIYALDSRGLHYREASTKGELDDITPLQRGNRARVEYGETQFDLARQIGSDQQDGTLRFLASATGGLLIRHTNNFEAAFGRIEQETRSYYLLSFRPRNLVFDGQFRRIRVALTKPGLEVRARSGYVAMPPGASVLTASEFRQLLEAAKGSEVADFPLYVEPAHFLENDGSYTVDLTLEVPLDALGFERKGGDFVIPLQVFGLVRDTGGEVHSSFRGPGRVLLEPKEFQAARQGYLMYRSRLRLGSGSYAVELLAVDGLKGRRSYRRASLRLEPVAKALAVSSLVLSHHVEPAPKVETSPWVVGNVRIFPCAERHFRDHQNLIFYFNVYYPAMHPERGRPDVQVKLSLLREGRPLQLALPVYEISDLKPAPILHMQVARYLKLAGLAPGAYVLRATVQDRVRGQSVVAQAPFELGP